MIRYLKRNQLDVVKYDRCIQNSLNSRIYAYSWYLDLVADSWDALILDDYKAVMPLPWKSKYFIKYIYPPPWTQQLGVFSGNTITSKLVSNFIASIPNKFKKVTIQFNSDNPIDVNKSSKRINYILCLSKSYNLLKKDFSKGRKKHTNYNFRISNEPAFDKTIALFKNTIGKHTEIDELSYKKLSKLIHHLSDKKKVLNYTAFNSNGILCAGAFFILDKNRITYLFSASNQEGRDNEMMVAIIKDVIKKFENTNYILDFEGSMLPGVANFCKSFGAIEEVYNLYQHKKMII